MNEATDVKFASTVKDSRCRASGSCTYPLVIFRVAHISDMYKQDLPARFEIALTNSGYINPLNSDLNPIHHLLALLGAHHNLHISRIRVNA